MSKRKQEIEAILNGLRIDYQDISLQNNGHYKITSDQLKRPVFTSSTPSCSRSNLNLKCELRNELKDRLQKRRTRRNFTNGERKEIVEDMVNNKLSQSATAEKYDLATSLLGRIVKQAKKRGVKFPNQKYASRKSASKYPQQLKDSLVSRVLKGADGRELAVKNNIPYQTLYTWVHNAKKKQQSGGDISYISSKPKKTHAQKAKNQFREALNVLSAMADTLDKLTAENDALRAENDTMKAKFELMAEAFKL